MKSKDGLTQADINDYDAAALDIIMLLDPCTPDECRWCDFVCECLWNALLLNRRNRDQADRSGEH